MAYLALLSTLLLGAPWRAPESDRVTVMGRAVERGVPVRGASVMAIVPRQGLVSMARVPLESMGRIVTDDRGAFSLEARAGGLALAVLRPGPDPLVRVMTVQVPGPDGEVVVDFDGDLDIGGRALDQSGTPIGGVRITAVPDPEDTGFTPGEGTLARTTTRPDGSFTLAGLLPGRYRLTAFGNHHASAPARGEGVLAEAGGEAVVVRLRRAPVLSGRVLAKGPDGLAPLADGFMLSSPAFGRREMARLDGSFQVALDGPRAALPLLFSAEGMAWRTLRVDVLTDEARDLGVVQLTPGRSRSGRVVDGAGAPVAGAVLRPGYLGYGLDPPLASTGENGTFRMEQVADGVSSVLVSHRDFPAAEAEVDQGDEELTIRLLAGGTLRVQVEDSEGRPLEARKVWIGPGSSCQTSAAGICSLPKLEAREHRLLLEHPRGPMRAGLPVPPLNVQVAAARSSEITIRVPEVSTHLRVEVIGFPANTSPRVAVVPGALAPEYPLDRTLASLPVYYEATERPVQNLPPGTYTAVAIDGAGPGRCARRTFELIGGSQVVSLQLPPGLEGCGAGREP